LLPPEAAEFMPPASCLPHIPFNPLPLGPQNALGPVKLKGVFLYILHLSLYHVTISLHEWSY
jgi:hypothetical protein